MHPSLHRYVRQIESARRERFRRKTKAKLPILASTDAPLMPVAAPKLVLRDRQRIEKLIRDNEGRGPGHGLEPLVPGDRKTRLTKRLFLPGGKDGTGLDQMDIECSRKSGYRLKRPQDIRHQRAPAGAQLNQLEGRRLVHRGPGVDAPNADQFAEHLAHFRRGDEVPAPPEWIARPVVAMFGMAETQLHVARDRKRPLLRDQVFQNAGQRRLPGAHVAGVLARNKSHRPTAIIGTESIMPMVAPPARNPIWSSGLRKNSTITRDAP